MVADAAESASPKKGAVVVVSRQQVLNPFLLEKLAQSDAGASRDLPKTQNTSSLVDDDVCRGNKKQRKQM